MDWLEQAIDKQRNYIENILKQPLSRIAALCSRHWHQKEELEQALVNYLKINPGHRCRLLYAIDREGLQHSGSISDSGADNSIIGRNLSQRPYLDQLDPIKLQAFVLSDVYIDKKTHQPCITALHSVIINDCLAGYIAADFGLKDLPLRRVDQAQSREWRQIKGDPSIRGTLFQQTRTCSAMDQHLDEVLDVVESLMTEQGIFHAKLHFSSSRATLWSYNDPYRYRLHVLEEIINPRVCLVYAKTPYPQQACITMTTIPKVLKAFKSLREADETIYLRAASLNVMNGFVGLNFSCDGSHYMPADEFLQKDLSFWFGDSGQLTCL